jgi:hypothetical protein
MSCRRIPCDEDRVRRSRNSLEGRLGVDSIVERPLSGCGLKDVWCDESEATGLRQPPATQCVFGCVFAIELCLLESV